MLKIKITENDLNQIVTEAVKKILSEGLENPWVYGGNDRWGNFYGHIDIGSKLFNAVWEKYQYTNYDDKMHDFETFLEALPVVNVKCGWENSPSINVNDSWIDDIDEDDIEKVKQEILTYNDKVLVKQALEVLDSVLNDLDIDEVILDEEPEPDYDYDDYDRD